MFLRIVSIILIAFTLIAFFGSFSEGNNTAQSTIDLLYCGISLILATFLWVMQEISDTKAEIIKKMKEMPKI